MGGIGGEYNNTVDVEKIKCEDCGREIDETSDEYEVCDKCGANLCEECSENHEC